MQIVVKNITHSYIHTGIYVYMHMCVCVCVLVALVMSKSLHAHGQSVVHQAPLSLGFSRQEY